jgi:putative ABC transport system ATP-binding protein
MTTSLAHPTTVPAVAVRGVTRTYLADKQRVDALRGVDLAFERGTFTAIMGPSGSGKSTLLQCMAGLDQPSSGDISIGRDSIAALSQARLSKLRRENVGFVFQQYNLIPSLTAAQNVALPLRLAGRRASRAAALDALATVGLRDRARHRPAQLSGGQQQRVAIARALVTSPEVIFADEPTGALDSKTGRAVLAMLRDMVDVHRHTVIMVTHDPRTAAYADRVVLLADGRVAGDYARPTPERIAELMAHLGES